MSSLLIHNARLVHPGDGIVPGAVLVADGKIAQLDPPSDQCPLGTEVVDGGGRLLSPGLIDVHTHGIHTYQYEAGPEDLLGAARVLGAYGTTCVLPTIVPTPEAKRFAHFEQLAEALPRVSGACFPGFHLEGPFMAVSGAVCSTASGDVTLLEELIAAFRGRIAAMSLSPDTPNIIPVIERLVERDMVPFITHTRADPEQTQAAIDAGARHATHFYDVFHLPPETEPGARPVGAVEAILADDRVSVDFICDGCHVHPVAVRAALAAKGYKGICLITDSVVGAGLPPGRYDSPWGCPVQVTEDRGVRIDDPDHRSYGSLVGSSLTMNRAVANVMKWLDLPPEKVWAMGTRNTARMLGQNNKGVIRAAADADLVLWNDDYTPARTWVAGQCVYPTLQNATLGN